MCILEACLLLAQWQAYRSRGRCNAARWNERPGDAKNISLHLALSPVTASNERVYKPAHKSAFHGRGNSASVGIK
jgi:hypothetical protein